MRLYNGVDVVFDAQVSGASKRAGTIQGFVATCAAFLILIAELADATRGVADQPSTSESMRKLSVTLLLPVVQVDAVIGRRASVAYSTMARTGAAIMADYSAFSGSDEKRVEVCGH